MTNRVKKFFLGLILLVSVSFIFSTKKSFKTEGHKNYNIMFNKIDGVNVGSEVLIAGVKVGYVNNIDLKKNYPLVSIFVEENINLPDDSSISIQTDGLFGAKFLLIEIGGNDTYLNENEFFSFYEDSILVEDLLRRIIELGELRDNEI